MVKFSIVVPIYNVENYLNECIESILNQGFKNYELILVNDGSTDKSESICDKFARSNSKISVIHKKNGGLSDARNNGMAKAKGEYIIFIDSDDFIESEAFERFNNELERFENPDVLITRLKEVYENSEPRSMDSNMPIELLKDGKKEDVVNWMFRKSNNLWPAPRYVVKRLIIKKYNLDFARGYLHEDLDWTSKIFLYAKTFTISGFYWYNHRMGRCESITTNKNPKRTLDVIHLASQNIKDTQYNFMDNPLRDIIFQRILKSLFFSLNDFKYYDPQGRKAVIEELEKNKDIFKYTTTFQHKIFVLFTRVFGFKISLLLMTVLHKA